MIRPGFIATLALLATAPMAVAAPADPLDAATNAMAEADFDKALGLLNSALAKAKKPEEVARIQLKRGEALVALQRLDEATQAFSAALAADPAARLDPVSSSPDALNALAVARRQILSELTVQIAGGAAATVKIDEVELGPAPLKTRVGAGKHRIEATGGAGQKATREIDVAPGKPMELSLELRAAEAPLPPPPPPPAAQASPAPAPRVTGSSAGRSKIGLVPVGVGAAMIGAGVVCLVQASGRHQQLVDPAGPRLDATTEGQLASEGSTFQALGWVGVGVGAAAAIAGTAMLLFMPGSTAKTVHVTGGATPGGGFVGLAGSFD